MQWILQDFEDNRVLGAKLSWLGIPVTYHKVVPFVGELDPVPLIPNPNNVIMFGSYSLRHYARKHNLSPGVFELRPFLYEKPWQPYLLNGIDAIVSTVRDLGGLLDTLALPEYFIRPVDDSKDIAGTVMDINELEHLVRTTSLLEPHEYISGSLNPETVVMLTEPVRIKREWRNWIVNDKVVTSSLYKLGSRVTYQEGIDPLALEFLERMVHLNPGYSPAYVLDVCETDDGYKIIETNCLNAAGFYAGDMMVLANALENHFG